MVCSTICSKGGPALRALGIDLAASVFRQTGRALVNEYLQCACATVKGDEEIIDFLKNFPNILVIDVPLSIPRGRHDIDDRTGPYFRKCVFLN